MTRPELSAFLPLIMRERDYLIVTDAQAKLIQSVENYSTLCIIERESGTVNWKNETLPDCLAGESRLWSRQDWDITSNVRNRLRLESEKLRVQAEQARERVQQYKELIISHFTSMGLTREVILKAIIGNQDIDMLESLYNGLKNTSNQPK